MYPRERTAGESSSRAENPYTRAYLGISRNAGYKGGTLGATNRVSDYTVHVIRKRSVRQRAKLTRAKRWASSWSLQRLEGLETGAAAFLGQATPTVGQLLTYTQNRHGYSPLAANGHQAPVTNQVEVARVQGAARSSVVREYARATDEGAYGWVPQDKPDNVIRMMYENFSSLSVFATGYRKHKKIRQINKLASDYGVDLISGCETRTDWHFVTDEESEFPNLFGNGLPSRGLIYRTVR